MNKRTVLVTGATGKVGRNFIDRVLAHPDHENTVIRALCHNRVLDASDRLEVVRGSIADRDVVRGAMDGVTHVLHLATCKETPEDVVSVTVGGLFWLLEECRTSDVFRQFILIGGDAAMGDGIHAALCDHPENGRQDLASALFGFGQRGLLGRKRCNGIHHEYGCTL